MTSHAGHLGGILAGLAYYYMMFKRFWSIYIEVEVESNLKYYYVDQNYYYYYRMSKRF